MSAIFVCACSNSRVSNAMKRSRSCDGSTRRRLKCWRIESVVQNTGFPHFDIIPSDRDLVGAEVEFVGETGWETRLKDVLAPLRDRYAAILLDCPPSLGHLTVLALTAADGVLVPLQCEYFALEGISELVSTIGRVQHGLNPDLAIFGVVLTMYDDRTNLSKDVAEEARRNAPRHEQHLSVAHGQVEERPVPEEEVEPEEHHRSDDDIGQHRGGGCTRRSALAPPGYGARRRLDTHGQGAVSSSP